MTQASELIFLVEDDPETAALLSRWLEASGTVEHVADAEECLAALGRYVPAVICMDINLPGMSGIEALEEIHARHPRIPIVMLTANEDVQTVVKTMQLGAYDYLTKPVDRVRLTTTVLNALERGRMGKKLRDLERRASATNDYEGIVGSSPSMQRLFGELDHVSTSDVTVLIQGESGTGKELVARAVHARSGRTKGPFVALNCAAIPESLIESELFGHEKGAFTGAAGKRIGRFEQARGGTLFLDEIAELALASQAKLLRALQERRIQRVGGTEDVRVDFRLVAATHRDLFHRVEEGLFREDLFYRIAVFEVDVPPLRERTGDLPLLCTRLLERHAPSTHLSAAALAVLSAHEFPGNVRELENALVRASVACAGGVITPADLPRRVREPRTAERAGTEAAPGRSQYPAVPSTAGTMEEIEREAIRRTLERTGGNVAEVVRELGIGRTTVYRKLKQYGLR